MEDATSLSNSPTQHDVSHSQPGFAARLLRVRELALIFLIVLIGIALQLITGKFFTTPNLNAISLGFATSAIIVFGMTAALVTGGFDLSVGSVFAMGGVTAAVALRAD